MRGVQRTCKTRRAAEFFKGKRENLQFAQEEKLALFPPEIVACKMGRARGPGQGAAGRGEAARLSALRTFPVLKKVTLPPSPPLSFLQTHLYLKKKKKEKKKKKKQLSIETDSPWPGRGDFNPLRSAIKGN